MPEFRRSDILFFFGIALVLLAAYNARNVLMVVYVSALFAVVLAPAIDFIRGLHIGRYRPSRGIAVLVLLVSILGAITLFFSLAGPPIYRDIRELGEHWPERSAQITEKIRTIPFLANFDTQRLQTYAAAALGGVLGFVQRFAGGLFGFFTWFIITAYFILDGERAFYWVLSMFRRDHRDRLERTFLRAETRMRNWLLGQAFLMLILGMTSAVVFGLLGVKYFYAIAVLTGLANIVPIIGPVIAATVASLVALIDSPLKTLGVIAFFLVYQQLETAFLTPRVMKTTVNLPPLAVIISLSTGGALAGVVGALVAVPTAALCAVLIDEYLVKKDAVPELAREEAARL